MTAETAVVHLVRYANGPEPVEAFLSSYRHDAGREHDLVLLCKGFPNVEALSRLRRKTHSLVSHEVLVPDDGRDLTAYLAAARVLPHRRLCFVNSYSEIAVPGWLAVLCGGLDRPGAGIAGATGSWASHRSFALSVLRLPNGYRGALGGRRELPAELREPASGSRRDRARHRVTAAVDLARAVAWYPPFPAPHVRTNGFVIERELLLSLHRGRLLTKSASYRFESGRRSLTAQIRDRGLTAVVVGRDGVAWPQDAWPEAELFWQGTQRDLVVTDNLTRRYEHASPAMRQRLARSAWGLLARPG